ncbi:hypothetical protein [Xanthomonas oryzae]|uniref:hypothetical protein n=1 Tax=Xanthomonas oryzae TaxID=347 RepID=UPI0013EA6125|nr:hypothetical protein [Xanthomonas oryzae]
MTEDNPVDLPIGSINTQFFAQVRNIRKLLQGLIHGSEPELTSVAINNAPEISGVLHAQGVSMPPIRFQDHAHEPRSLQAVAVCIQVLRFPHISSCEIKHLLHQGVEEGARMGHASR